MTTIAPFATAPSGVPQPAYYLIESGPWRVMSQQNILLIQDDPSDAKVVCDALVNSIDGPFKVEWMKGAMRPKTIDARREAKR